MVSSGIWQEAGSCMQEPHSPPSPGPSRHTLSRTQDFSTRDVRTGWAACRQQEGEVQVLTHPHSRTEDQDIGLGLGGEPQLWAREATLGWAGLGLEAKCPSVAEAFRIRVKASAHRRISNPEPR